MLRRIRRAWRRSRILIVIGKVISAYFRQYRIEGVTPVARIVRIVRPADSPPVLVYSLPVSHTFSLTSLGDTADGLSGALLRKTLIDGGGSGLIFVWIYLLGDDFDAR